jgi:hypothetical protein
MSEAPNIIRLYTNAQVACQGAIWPMFRQELMEVMRDFCQVTSIFNQAQTLSIVPGTQSYTLTPPPSAAIKRILSVQNENNPSPYSAVNFPYTLQLPGTFFVQRQPQNDETWIVTYSLYPVDPTDTNGDPIFPNWILDNYFDGIYSGLLYRMHAQQRKTYTNPQLAVTHARLYAKARGVAKADVLMGNNFNGQAWQVPGSYATYGRQRGV